MSGHVPADQVPSCIANCTPFRTRRGALSAGWHFKSPDLFVVWSTLRTKRVDYRYPVAVYDTVEELWLVSSETYDLLMSKKNLDRVRDALRDVPPEQMKEVAYTLDLTQYIARRGQAAQKPATPESTPVASLFAAD